MSFAELGEPAYAHWTPIDPSDCCPCRTLSFATPDHRISLLWVVRCGSFHRDEEMYAIMVLLPN